MKNLEQSPVETLIGTLFGQLARSPIELLMHTMSLLLERTVRASDVASTDAALVREVDKVDMPGAPRRSAFPLAFAIYGNADHLF